VPGSKGAPLQSSLLASVSAGRCRHFALGRATGLPHLGIPETAATHGVLNALGVGLCGLLAWHRAGGARL
jgi:hypothetical protein